MNCGTGGTWFNSVSQQQLHPVWNAPVQGTEDPLPEAQPDSTGPISFDLSDRYLFDSYRGYLEIEVTGLALGQTILLERFLVDNADGIINEGAFLLDSRLITDGYLPLIGDEPNYNETLDYYEIDFEAVTDIDGEIYSYFPVRGGLESIPGEYVYRVSSPNESFAPQIQQLSIYEDETNQSFTGRVLSGDTPVAGAFVGLLESVGAYSHLRQVTRADENGDYIIYAPFSDEFELVAMAPGYVGPFWVATDEVIEDGETIQLDLALTPGTRTIAGTVVDSVSGDPIPGLPVTLLTCDDQGLPNGESYSHAWTDSQGAFSVSVTEDIWGVFFKPSDLASRSYLTPGTQALAVIDVTEGDVINAQVSLVKGTSLIWGTLTSGYYTDGEGEPLPLEGVEVFAYNFDDLIVASAVTYEDGTFFLAVTPGHWSVSPFSYDLELIEEPGSFNIDVFLPGEDQSIEIAMSTREFFGVLDGNLLDPNLDPVGKVRLLAFNLDTNYKDYVVQTTYGSSGYYNFYLGAGSWMVVPDSGVAADRQLLFVDFPLVEIPQGGDPFFDNYNEVDTYLAEPTGTIEVTLLDSEMQPIQGIRMHGISEGGLHGFGRTDASGVARIPAVDDNWEIHVHPGELREAGKRQVAPLFVTVSGATASLQASAVDFTGDAPSMDEFSVDEDLQFYVGGSGEAGRRYLVEGTRNLKDWMTLGRVVAIDGSFTILDDPEQALPTEQPAESVVYRLKSE